MSIGDVRHVLELKKNLISLNALDSIGHWYTLEYGADQIEDPWSLSRVTKPIDIRHLAHSIRPVWFGFCKRL